MVTPTATIAGQSAAVISTGGNSYNASFTMTDSQSDGTVSFSINFIDAAGNSGIAVTSTTDSSSVTFDKSAPTLSVVSISSNNANSTIATIGDQINISLTANESLLSDPVVAIAGHATTVSGSGGNSYNATYTMVSNDTEGIVSFTINFTDAAGNAGTQVTSTTDSSSVYKTLPPVITITNPENNSINRTGYVNVTATLDKNGKAAYLNWNGLNYSMMPNTSQPEGTVFYKNMTGLLSQNYSLKVYANDSNGLVNISETRIVEVNRTIIDTTIGEFINHTTHVVNSTIEIIAPSGNVTVTILNGTNASINGEHLTWISIDSPGELNSTFKANLGSGHVFVGENLSLGPGGALFNPDIQIRFNYTGAQLSAAGISASELRIKFYNVTSNTWVELTPYFLNATGHYIIANVSHFSTFALIGVPAPIYNPPSSGSGGGSSGGGGGGGASGENTSNIEVIEKYDLQISKDVTTSYRFNDPKNPIMFVNIIGNTSFGVITTSIEVLKTTSTLVKISPEGLIYKNANIWVGTSGYATPKNIKQALIKFKVDNSWMSSNTISGTDIKLLRWNGKEWEILETNEINKDSSYTYFEAKTYNFSPFSIVGMKSESAKVSDPGVTTPEVKQTHAAVTNIPEKETSNNYIYLNAGLIVFIILVLIAVQRISKDGQAKNADKVKDKDSGSNAENEGENTNSDKNLKDMIK